MSANVYKSWCLVFRMMFGFPRRPFLSLRVYVVEPGAPRRMYYLGRRVPERRLDSQYCNTLVPSLQPMTKARAKFWDECVGA
jgi:hypothetical protein